MSEIKNSNNVHVKDVFTVILDALNDVKLIMMTTLNFMIFHTPGMFKLILKTFSLKT